jgi:hypothetical protein
VIVLLGGINMKNFKVLEQPKCDKEAIAKNLIQLEQPECDKEAISKEVEEICEELMTSSIDWDALAEEEQMMNMYEHGFSI